MPARIVCGMNNGQSLFSQLISFANQYDFNECVKRYDDGTKVRKFSYWDQFFEKFGTKLLGADIDAIKRGEDREVFKKIVATIGG
jgi:hypothetical protein